MRPLETKLLAESGAKPGTTLDDWLRNSFFEQHCKRFHHRPFIWHIWDGRKDGFARLVNYHQLDHERLETLTYAYLQDWITAQAADAKAHKTGADLRLSAAQELQAKLKLILNRRAPSRHLRPLEAPLRPTDRLESRPQRRRPPQHPPLSHRRHPPLDVQDHQMDQRPWQRTPAPERRVPLVLEGRYLYG